MLGSERLGPLGRQEREPASTPVGLQNQRGGFMDIEDKPGKSKVEEAAEASFPASDPPSCTPDYYDFSPPPFKR